MAALQAPAFDSSISKTSKGNIVFGSNLSEVSTDAGSADSLDSPREDHKLQDILDVVASIVGYLFSPLMLLAGRSDGSGKDSAGLDDRTSEIFDTMMVGVHGEVIVLNYPALFASADY